MKIPQRCLISISSVFTRILYRRSSATFFPAIFLCFFWYRKQEIANRISPMIWNIQFFPSTFIKKGIKTKIIDQNHQLHYHFCQKNEKKVKIVKIVPFSSSEGSQSEEGRTSFWMLIGWERTRATRATRLYLARHQSLPGPSLNHVTQDSLFDIQTAPLRIFKELTLQKRTEMMTSYKKWHYSCYIVF